MAKKGEQPKLRCPSCGKIIEAYRAGGSKGLERYYCPDCCLEISVIPKKGVINVYQVDWSGDLILIFDIILL